MPDEFPGQILVFAGSYDAHRILGNNSQTVFLRSGIAQICDMTTAKAGVCADHLQCTDIFVFYREKTFVEFLPGIINKTSGKSFVDPPRLFIFRNALHTIFLRHDQDLLHVLILNIHFFILITQKSRKRRQQEDLEIIVIHDPLHEADIVRNVLFRVFELVERPSVGIRDHV